MRISSRLPPGPGAGCRHISRGTHRQPASTARPVQPQSGTNLSTARVEDRFVVGRRHRSREPSAGRTVASANVGLCRPACRELPHARRCHFREVTGLDEQGLDAHASSAWRNLRPAAPLVKRACGPGYTQLFLGVLDRVQHNVGDVIVSQAVLDLTSLPARRHDTGVAEDP